MNPATFGCGASGYDTVHQRQDPCIQYAAAEVCDTAGDHDSPQLRPDVLGHAEHTMVASSIDRQCPVAIENDVGVDGNLSRRHHSGRPVAFKRVWTITRCNGIADTLLRAGK